MPRSKKKKEKPKITSNGEKKRARKWAKDTLPLLKVLKSFKKGEQRSVLLRYLNDEACESIYHMIANIMRNEKMAGKKQKAFEALTPYKADLRRLCRRKATTEAGERRLSQFKRNTLSKMGGGVLTTLLAIGVPMLIDALSK